MPCFESFYKLKKQALRLLFIDFFINEIVSLIDPFSNWKLIMCDFSYDTLKSKFFVGSELISTKKERIQKCLDFVSTKTSGLSVKSQKIILKKVSSLELTFMKKWRESKCVADRFRADNVQWLNKNLQVHSNANM